MKYRLLFVLVFATKSFIGASTVTPTIVTSNTTDNSTAVQRAPITLAIATTFETVGSMIGTIPACFPQNWWAWLRDRLRRERKVENPYNRYYMMACAGVTLYDIGQLTFFFCAISEAIFGQGVICK